MGIILRRLKPLSPRAFKMRSVRLDSVEYPIASFPGHDLGMRLHLVGVKSDSLTFGSVSSKAMYSTTDIDLFFRLKNLLMSLSR